MTSQIDDMVRGMHQWVNNLRSVKKQVEDINERIKERPGTDTLVKMGKSIAEKIANWEQHIITTQQETFQDVINFYNKLSTELLDLRGRMENAQQPKVPEGHKKRFAQLKQEWATHEAALNVIIKDLVPAFNRLYATQQLPAVIEPK